MSTQNDDLAMKIKELWDSKFKTKDVRQKARTPAGLTVKEVFQANGKPPTGVNVLNNIFDNNQKWGRK